MTPRREVDMIDLTADPDDIRRTIVESVHSRLPAHAGTSEEMLGVVQAKDLLDRISARSLAPPNNDEFNCCHGHPAVLFGTSSPAAIRARQLVASEGWAASPQRPGAEPTILRRDLHDNSCSH
jgi:hypothetical protein